MAPLHHAPPGSGPTPGTRVTSRWLRAGGPEQCSGPQANATTGRKPRRRCRLPTVRGRLPRNRNPRHNQRPGRRPQCRSRAPRHAASAAWRTSSRHAPSPCPPRKRAARRRGFPRAPPSRRLRDPSPRVETDVKDSLHHVAAKPARLACARSHRRCGGEAHMARAMAASAPPTVPTRNTLETRSWSCFAAGSTRECKNVAPPRLGVDAASATGQTQKPRCVSRCRFRPAPSGPVATRAQCGGSQGFLSLAKANAARRSSASTPTPGRFSQQPWAPPDVGLVAPPQRTPDSSMAPQRLRRPTKLRKRVAPIERTPARAPQARWHRLAEPSASRCDPRNCWNSEDPWVFSRPRPNSAQGREAPLAFPPRGHQRPIASRPPQG
mmetsp:Transcript_100553/g.283585  ORF Transcript_100553/g.283585 Transcript_100553/m.283585 type:complete len:380 (-) Transcript_100553:1439-2578(-)